MTLNAEHPRIRTDRWGESGVVQCPAGVLELKVRAHGADGDRGISIMGSNAPLDPLDPGLIPIGTIVVMFLLALVTGVIAEGWVRFRRASKSGSQRGRGIRVNLSRSIDSNELAGSAAFGIASGTLVAAFAVAGSYLMDLFL